MGFFSNLRDSFRRATSSNVAASDRNKSSGRSNPSTAAGRVAQNLMSDLAISFGNTTGVSAAGIKDYEERTAASKAAMEKFQADTRNNDSGSSSSQPASTTTTTTNTAEPNRSVIEDITPDTTTITDPQLN